MHCLPALAHPGSIPLIRTAEDYANISPILFLSSIHVPAYLQPPHIYSHFGSPHTSRNRPLAYFTARTVPNHLAERDHIFSLALHPFFLARSSRFCLRLRYFFLFLQVIDSCKGNILGSGTYHVILNCQHPVTWQRCGIGAADFDAC
jgi:hypothetical protein